MRAPLALRLSARLARSHGWRPGAWLVATSALVLVVMFVILSSLSLSGQQVVDRDLGRFGAFVGYGSVSAPPGDTRTTQAIVRAAVEAGAADAAVMLVAVDVQATEDRRRILNLSEAPWTDGLFPDRYLLQEGRWPAAAGEVVWTTSSAETPEVGAVVPVFGQAASVYVVGHAADVYARSSSLLAAPGTWASLPSTVADRYSTALAQPVLFWDGAGQDRVVEAFRRAVAGFPGAETTLVEETLGTREQLLRRGEVSWIDRSAAGYRIPAVLLPVLAVAMLLGLNAKRVRGTAGAMIAVGMNRGATWTALALAAFFWTAGGAAAGLLSGAAVGFAARGGLQLVRERPAGPYPQLTEPFAEFLALAALAIVPGVLVLARTARTEARATPAAAHARAEGDAPADRGRRAGSGSRRALRPLAASCLLLYTCLSLPAVTTPSSASWATAGFTCALLLLLPDINYMYLRVLPERRLRSRLARRRLLRDPWSFTVAVALSTVLVSASSGYLVLFGSILSSLDTSNYPDVLTGQVLLQDRASIAQAPPAPALKVAVEAGLPPAQSIPLAYSVAVDPSGDAESTAAVADSGQTLLVLPDTAAVVGLLNGSPGKRALDRLSSGGALIWGEGFTGESVALVITGDTTGPRDVALAADAIRPPRASWAVGAGGVVLRATAEAAGLPVSAQGPILFHGLQSEQLRAVAEEVRASGTDAATVLVPRSPPPVIPHAGLVLTVVGLATLAVVGTAVATRGHIRSLAEYAGQLGSLGVSPGWTRGVLALQVAHVLVVATVASAAVTLPPLFALAGNAAGFALDVPVREVLILLSVVYCTTAASSLWSMRHLSAQPAAG